MKAAEAAMQGRTLAGDWQPDGGRILRDGGQATGVFVDGALDLVRKVMPAPDDAYREQALECALFEIGRAACRGRRRQYVWFTVVTCTFINTRSSSIYSN